MLTLPSTTLVSDKNTSSYFVRFLIALIIPRLRSSNIKQVSSKPDAPMVWPIHCLYDVAINGVWKICCSATFSDWLLDLVPVPCVLTNCISLDDILAVCNAPAAALKNPWPSSRWPIALVLSSAAVYAPRSWALLLRAYLAFSKTARAAPCPILKPKLWSSNADGSTPWSSWSLVRHALDSPKNLSTGLLTASSSVSTITRSNP